MTEHSYQAVFRAPKSTLTGVLRSPAFLHSRERASAIVDDPEALRDLAEQVEQLTHANPALSALSDRIRAAVSLLRAKADGPAADRRAQAEPPEVPGSADLEPVPAAGRAARERLVIAALHYLITPVDLIPDFRAGGYLDDVLLLSWVFGAAVNELDPYLADQQSSRSNEPAG